MENRKLLGAALLCSLIAVGGNVFAMEREGEPAEAGEAADIVKLPLNEEQYAAVIDFTNTVGKDKTWPHPDAYNQWLKVRRKEAGQAGRIDKLIQKQRKMARKGKFMTHQQHAEWMAEIDAALDKFATTGSEKRTALLAILFQTFTGTQDLKDVKAQYEARRGGEAFVGEGESEESEEGIFVPTTRTRVRSRARSVEPAAGGAAEAEGWAEGEDL